MKCSKCKRKRELYEFETETGTYHFCIDCLKESYARLGLLLYKNKETRKLYKSIKKILKHEKVVN